jgi:CubicO group peptidase (beta-lactamase class C family)
VSGAVLVLSLLASAAAPPASVHPRQAAVDALFAPFDRRDSPGVAVAVTQNGEVVLERCYGMADLEHGLPITPDTTFDVASLAKQFTGMSVAMLASTGRLDLDADVRQLLPDIVHGNVRVTPRQLLHHTSGIRDWVGLLPLVNRDPTEGLRFGEILDLTRGLRELDFEPDTEWHYSNTGYNLLAEIVSRTTGTPFPEWTAEHIFRPLGMDRARFRQEPFEQIPGLATSYFQEEGKWRAAPDLASAYGPASLFLSIRDLARWALNYEDGTVGGPEVLEQMQEQAVLKDGRQLNYAYGLGVGGWYGLRILNHGGDFSGFVSSWVTFPEEHLSVVLLANNREVDSFKVMEIADLFLPPRREAPASEGPEEAPLAPDVLVGAWLLEPGRLLQIAREKESWVARGTWREPEAVTPLGGRRFRLEDSGLVLELRDEAGEESKLFVGGRPAAPAEPWTPPGDELRAWTGLYLSPELSVCHRIELEDGTLVLRRPLGPAVSLRPTIRDQLGGREWWAAALDAERDENGRIAGFRLTNSKVRGVRFLRVADSGVAHARADLQPADGS